MSHITHHMSYRVRSYHAASHHITSHRIALSYRVTYHGASHHTKPHHITSHLLISFHISYGDSITISPIIIPNEKH